MLALQGDFALHRRALERAGAQVSEVRTREELTGLDAVVLPGGESSAMLKLMEKTDLEAGLRAFHAAGGYFFGTCAGLILLAKGVSHPEQRSLGLLDVDVERNGYGRQINSFETDLAWTEAAQPVRGVFIRAPRIGRVGEGVRVLAEREGEPVLVLADRVVAATFHPELTDDIRLHAWFVDQVARGAVPARRG